MSEAPRNGGYFMPSVQDYKLFINSLDFEKISDGPSLAIVSFRVIANFIFFIAISEERKGINEKTKAQIKRNVDLIILIFFRKIIISTNNRLIVK